MQTFSGLQKAVRCAGDTLRFAAALGINEKTVITWLKQDGTDVPAETRPAETGIRKAVEKAGSGKAMARALNVSHQAVGIWIKQGFVPQARAKEIEMLYGVDRAELVSPKVRSVMGVGGEL